MRLVEVEKPLKEAVSQYIRETYAAAGAPPDVKVLDYREYADRFPGLVGIGPALYHIKENTLYFIETPFAYDVGHEVHHWQQAQRLGKDRFLEELKSTETRERYEAEADNVATINLANMSYHMRSAGLLEPEETYWY